MTASLKFGEDYERGSDAYMSTERRQIPIVDANLFHFVFLSLKQICSNTQFADQN